MVLRHELGRRRGAPLPPEPAADDARAASPGRRLRAAALRLTTRPDDGAVCIAGPERLRLLEKLLPFAQSLRVYGPPPTSTARRRAERLGARPRTARRVVFVLSPELFRGFSGEGGVLCDLAAADDAAVEAVAELLHGEPAIDSAAVARDVGFDRTTVETALGALGAAGRVGYDLAPGVVLPPGASVRPCGARVDASASARRA